MADTNTQDQGTQGQVQDQGSASGDTNPAKVYATKVSTYWSPTLYAVIFNAIRGIAPLKS